VSATAKDEPLEHGLVDEATGHLLVGAQGVHLRLIDRGRDEVAIHRVEIDQTAGRIGFAAERHENEAQWPRHGCLGGVTSRALVWNRR
jgi:hypothetical protein